MFIPDELVYLCSWLIQGAAMESSVIGSLIQRLSSKHCLMTLGSVLATMPQAPPVLSQVGRNYQYRGACWLSGLVFLGLAWQYSWTFLLGLIPVILLYCKNRKEEYDTIVFLSALMLSMEILYHDFAGWGTAFPKAKSQALEILTNSSQHPMIGEWLNFILLHDRKVEPDWANQFTPYSQRNGILIRI